MKISVISPYILRKFELSDKTGTDHESRYAAVGTIVWSVFGQRQTIGSAAANHAAAVYVRCSIARVHTAHVRTEGHRISEGIHLFVVEVVVALHVGAQCRILFIGSQHEGSAASPSTHQLRREEFLLLGRLAMLSQKVPKLAHVFL